MKYLKMLGLAAVSAMALMAFFGASSASATTLEVAGKTKNESITITASLKSGTSAVLRDTFFISANTCTGSHAHGSTESPYTGARVHGPFTSGENGLSFSGCDNPVTVHNPGGLTVEHITGTTNGRVYSTSAQVTVWSSIHNTYITCTTAGGEGTLIGTLTGVSSGHATLDVNATLNCGEHLSSAKWTGTYTVTTPTGLGISA